ncbi:monovalent cation/H+ antiporter subunit E [Haloarchaeobius salinus]|uniref:monovalent cation/H+ antiporter subunit E n=1 Tax=Haloarchaeobius salinus TaxID=1198298 RepID=UPI00210B40D7|nr:monovalent cation/H+ antiporter subunit E [Haloarchaeobius salinus]
MTGARLLVPVSESDGLRRTVSYAIRTARERGEDGEGRPTVHFVYPLSQRLSDDGPPGAVTELLEQVSVWAAEDIGDEEDGEVIVETAVVGADRYLFSPTDYADILAEYVRENDVDTVVFDPDYNPGGTSPLLPPIEAELQRRGIDIAEAPVEREHRGGSLTTPATVGQFLALFGVSYVFYLLLAGSLATYELVTGFATAAVTAGVLWQVPFRAPFDPVRLLRQSGRIVLYTPFLLWEIAKANVQLARIVLHPKLPIEPELVEYEVAVWSDLAVATLANSITLTPGTLTVSVTKNDLVIHSLTESDREGLFAGTLERPVRFVFYGLSAARRVTPAMRRAEEGDDR